MSYIFKLSIWFYVYKLKVHVCIPGFYVTDYVDCIQNIVFGTILLHGRSFVRNTEGGVTIMKANGRSLKISISR